MGTKDLVKVICMSNGFAQLTAGYELEYLVGKAVDAANLCALCADPLAVALKFAATFGNTINSMSPDAIAMHVDSISAALEGKAHQDLLTVIGTFPNIEELPELKGVVTEEEMNRVIAEKTDEHLKAINHQANNYRIQIEGLVKALEEAKAAKPTALETLGPPSEWQPLADLIEEPKQGDPLSGPPFIPDVPGTAPTEAGGRWVDPALEAASQAASQNPATTTEDVKEPEVGLVASLAIPPKQKKAMAAAGLVTFEDVIKFHKEKTLESLPVIGEVSQGHILNLVGFKE